MVKLSICAVSGCRGDTVPSARVVSSSSSILIYSGAAPSAPTLTGLPPPPETAGFSSPLQFCGHESECFSLAVAVEAARCACSDSILHVSLKRSPRTPLSHFLVGFTCVIPTLLWGKAGFSWISWDSRRCDLLTFPPCSLLGPFAICCGRKLRRGQSGEQDRASQTVPLGGRAR